MTISHLIAFAGTLLVLAVVPGPSDAAVVARSLASGFTQALIMVSGIVVADLLFILLAVYSLSELADSFANLFAIVKYICGFYLIWLGTSTFRSQASTSTTSERPKTIGYSSFFAGLLMTLGDPKAILFYMGLFPAFVDLATITIAQILTLMAIAACIVGGVKASYAYLADRAKQFFNNTRIRNILNKVAGSVLVITGLWLLLDRS